MWTEIALLICGLGIVIPLYLVSDHYKYRNHKWQYDLTHEVLVGSWKSRSVSLRVCRDCGLMQHKTYDGWDSVSIWCPIDSVEEYQRKLSESKGIIQAYYEEQEKKEKEKINALEKVVTR